MEFDKLARIQSLNEKTYTICYYRRNITGKMNLDARTERKLHSTEFIHRPVQSHSWLTSLRNKGEVILVPKQRVTKHRRMDVMFHAFTTPTVTT